MSECVTANGLHSHVGYASPRGIYIVIPVRAKIQSFASHLQEQILSPQPSG